MSEKMHQMECKKWFCSVVLCRDSTAPLVPGKAQNDQPARASCMVLHFPLQQLWTQEVGRQEPHSQRLEDIQIGCVF